MEGRPTLLMLGQNEPMRAALEEGLARHATFAEVADGYSPVAAVMAAAPDLVVLVGDAVQNYHQILEKLASNGMTSSVPVVLLAPPNLEVQMSAARRGVRIVERTASADKMSKQIAKLARELPERPTHTSGAVGEATLHELLDIVKRKLETGILSVSQEGSGGKGARFVLQPGRNVDAAVRDFVRRIKPLLKEDKPLQYEFIEAGSGLMVLDGLMEAGDRAQLAGRRILLVEDDAAVADALAHELRAHGVITVVCTTAGGGIERARELDPEIVLIDEAALDGETYAVLRQIRRDLTLRWASLLIVRVGDVLPQGEAPRIDHLAASVASLLAADREVATQAREEKRFETRLEALGPSRLLRAIAASGKTYQVTVRHPRAMVEVSLAEGIVAGAEAVPMGGASRRVAGTSALAALLALGSGRVTVEVREAPATANLLMPVDVALARAAQETPPIRPSLPPAGESIPPPRRSSARGLLTELKGLLQRMKEVDGLAEDIADEVRTAETLLPFIDPPDEEGPHASPPMSETATVPDEQASTTRHAKLADMPPEVSDPSAASAPLRSKTVLGMPAPVVARPPVPTPASRAPEVAVPRGRARSTVRGSDGASPSHSVPPPPPPPVVSVAAGPVASVRTPDLPVEEVVARATFSAVPPPPPAAPTLAGTTTYPGGGTSPPEVDAASAPPFPVGAPLAEASEAGAIPVLQSDPLERFRPAPVPWWKVAIVASALV